MFHTKFKTCFRPALNLLLLEMFLEDIYLTIAQKFASPRDYSDGVNNLQYHGTKFLSTCTRSSGDIPSLPFQKTWHHLGLACVVDLLAHELKFISLLLLFELHKKYVQIFISASETQTFTVIVSHEMAKSLYMQTCINQFSSYN